MNKIVTTLLFLSLLSCSQDKYAQGERVYNKLCANCHMPDGSGLSKLIPSLKLSLPTITIADQVCIIKNGINADSLGMAMKVMPSFDKIKPVELTNLINYLNNTWNDTFQENSLQIINLAFDKCK